MIDSLSVIVPVYNCESYIARTLESIEQSVQVFQTRHPQAAQVSWEVIVVNDASPDRTLAVVEQFIETASAYGREHYRITSHSRSLGAGPARNTGARLAQGEILFFCDGDDLFLPEHLYRCYLALNQELAIANASALELHLDPVPEPQSVPHPVVAVATQALIQEAIHPGWKVAIENSLLINFCVRRDCHDFIEGFPEAAVYKQIRGREDITYRKWIAQFFPVHHLPLETVEYIRYPGNSFDRQMQKFQTPPQQFKLDWSPEEKPAHAIADRLETEHLQYLTQKLTQLDMRFTPASLIQWRSLLVHALTQKRHADAVSLYERGVPIQPQVAQGIVDQLARAYNNLGTQQHKRGQLDLAARHFQRSLDLNPNYPTEDLAKIYFNLGMVRADQSRFDAALICLQEAQRLDPHLAPLQSTIAQIRYHQDIQHRGYEFTQDWFSNNLLIWQNYLLPLAGRSGFQLLEIGSWEGRSTCWFLQHLLTHETAQITCVDTFEGSLEHRQFSQDYLETIESRFDANIAKSGAATKVKKCVGKSQDVLRSLPVHTYDLLYIDGSHLACDVLQDALLGWGLVKIGGWILFDDYGFSFSSDPNHETKSQNPKVSIDAFLQIFHAKLKIIHRSYQVLLQKTVE